MFFVFHCITGGDKVYKQFRYTFHSYFFLKKPPTCLCTISKLHLHNNIEITEKWEKNQHDDILILFEVDDKYMLLDNVVTILTLHVLF